MTGWQGIHRRPRSPWVMPTPGRILLVLLALFIVCGYVTVSMSWSVWAYFL